MTTLSENFPLVTREFGKIGIFFYAQKYIFLWRNGLVVDLLLRHFDKSIDGKIGGTYSGVGTYSCITIDVINLD